MNEQLWIAWMKKNYPNLRLDSVTAGQYKEVFFGALESCKDKFIEQEKLLEELYAHKEQEFNDRFSL